MFKLIKPLGEGQFGKVFLASFKNEDQEQYFAVKCLNKRLVVELKMEKYAQEE